MACTQTQPKVVIICKLWVVAGMLLASLLSVSYAQTAAGTELRAQGIVQYQDPAGNEYTAQSNISVLEVGQIYSAYHLGDAHKFAQAGAAVSFPFVVANTGNGEDTYIVGNVGQWTTDYDDIDFSTAEVFLDANGNGLADPGEVEATSFTLASGTTQNLVFVGTMPILAAGQKAGVNYAITTLNGSVTDYSGAVGVATSNGGDVNHNDFVNFMATISSDAIINVTNDTVHDEAARTITQTITVTNVGGADAYDVSILTFDPVDCFIDTCAARDRPSHVSIEASGLSAANGDVLPAYTDANLYQGNNVGGENTLNYDLNGDGDLDDTRGVDFGFESTGLRRYPEIDIIAAASRYNHAVDDVLAAGGSVNITIVHDYSTVTNPITGLVMPVGFTMATNAFVSWDSDDDGDNLSDNFTSSNISVNKIPQFYDAQVDELATPASVAGVNDGGNDSSLGNHIRANGQSLGEDILFLFQVTNTGNGTDTIELDIGNRTPSGNSVDLSESDIEEFSLWSSDGLTLLLNTNSVLGVDTGPMAAGESRMFMAKIRVALGSNTSKRINAAIVANSAAEPIVDRTAVNFDSSGYFGYSPLSSATPFVILQGYDLEALSSDSSLSYGIDFSGFNPNAPASGPGSCGTGEAFTSLKDAKTVINKGRYCFDLGAGEFLADVDTAEGGGWVLVLQYIHKDGTDPSTNIIGAAADFPVTSDAALGDDEGSSTTSWGHAGNAAVQQFFDAGTIDIETRWYGATNIHNRIIHFYSTVGDDYMRTGTGNFSGIQSDFVSLTGHTAYLPGDANFGNASGTSRGDNALIDHPFFSVSSSTLVWTSGNGRYEVDNYQENVNRDTHHRVWIRDTATPVAANIDAGISAYVEGDVGETVSLPLVIRNNGYSSESYSLAAGKSYIADTLGAMHDGWSAVFKDGNGSVIDSTALVPPDGEWTGTIEVTISANLIEAYYQNPNTNPIDDAGTITIDANSNAENDYPIFVTATGNTSAQASVILNAVDVNLLSQMGTISPEAQVQIRAGAFLETQHTFTSQINATQDRGLSISISEPGWSSVILVDTDGDGTADGSYETANTVYVTDNSGNYVPISLASQGGTAELAGSVEFAFIIRTFAPSNAAAGAYVDAIIEAKDAGGMVFAAATNRYTITDSQLILSKTASVDAVCADSATNDLGPDIGFADITASAEPNDCVIWQVVASNGGASPLNDVTLVDLAGAFSVYKTGTLRACVGDAGQSVAASCSFTVLDDANDSADEAYADNGTIKFEFGVGASPILPTGTLQGGQSLTVRYATQIE